VSESAPRLNTSLYSQSQLSPGDSVTLTCSITCHSELMVTLTLTEASRTINTTSLSHTGSNNYRVTATVRAKEPQFGPFRCLAVFTQHGNTSDKVARNSVELRSNETQAIQLFRTF